MTKAQDKKKEEDLEFAIAKYKKLYWKKPHCDLCGTSEGEIKKDTELCEILCEKCLDENLRDNPSDLMELVQ